MIKKQRYYCGLVEIYTTVKVFVAVREGERKVVCDEELTKKAKDVYSARKQS